MMERSTARCLLIKVRKKKNPQEGTTLVHRKQCKHPLHSTTTHTLALYSPLTSTQQTPLPKNKEQIKIDNIY